jgi:hypothetical protein
VCGGLGLGSSKRVSPSPRLCEGSLRVCFEHTTVIRPFGCIGLLAGPPVGPFGTQRAHMKVGWRVESGGFLEFEFGGEKEN